MAAASENIDFFTLQCFIAVAETGSFTKAAERVGRTQSAISQQMAKLESIVAKPILQRGKGYGLTPDGEIFLGYARQIFSLYSEAFDRLKMPELAGEIRFGLPDNFASSYLAEVLADFSRQHPRIRLLIECDLSVPLYERFRKHEFEMVLLKMNRPEDIPYGIDVWSEPLMWVGDVSQIEDSKSVPLILSPPPCVYRAAAIAALEQANLSYRIVFSSPSYSSLLSAARAGMGLTVIPHTMIPDDLHAIEHSLLPKLNDTHISVLKHEADNAIVNTLESFVIKRLRHN